MVRSKPGQHDLEIADIPPYLKKIEERTDVPTEAEDLPLPQALDIFERRLITGALKKHKGNLSAAARGLGIIRQSLAYRMKRLGLVKN